MQDTEWSVGRVGLRSKGAKKRRKEKPQNTEKWRGWWGKENIRGIYAKLSIKLTPKTSRAVMSNDLEPLISTTTTTTIRDNNSKAIILSHELSLERRCEETRAE